MVSTTPQRSGLPRMFALIPAAILLLATLSLDVDHLALGPGPEVDIVPLVEIDGVETDEINGRVLLTAVSVWPARTVAEVLRWWVQPSVEVVPRRALVPPDRSDDEERRLQSQLMEQSQLFAAAAALELLGYEVQVTGAGVQVVRVEPDVPAAEVLQLGDVIVAADGRPISQGEELIDQVQSHNVGEEIRLRVIRDGEEFELGVRTVPQDEEPTRPMIGVGIQTLLGDVQLPVPVRIDAGNIGGPSAGLMFALTVIDLLDPDDLLAGRTVAGTGIIALTGEVGRVGGVRQKIAAARRAGADVFFSPRAILESACAAARGMAVIAVDDLQDAVDALRDPDITARGSCS